MKILQLLKELLVCNPAPILITQKTGKPYFAILFFLIPFLSQAQVDEVLVEWDLAACKAFEDSDNYSELVPSFPNESHCLSASNVFRNHPETNQHSCAPGVSGTDGVAMCVGAEAWYLFFDNSAKAIRFETTINAAPTEPVTLKSLNFYEKAAPIAEQLHTSDVINNNYPRVYGVRILANGQEIFKQTDIPTSTEWSLETIDFSNNPSFYFDELTLLEFELLAYFPIANGHSAIIWDIDNISIIGNCDAVVLPVELKDFTARALNKQQVTLDWTTSSEENNRLFEIQRSTDGLSFKTIGSVIGQGTTDRTNHYHFLDKTPAPGVNYYRLKQLDFDGAFEYSGIKGVQMDAKYLTKLILYPNPAKSETSLRMVNAPELDATVQVMNNLGQILKTFPMEHGTIEKSIDLTDYKAGLYFIQVTYGDKQRVSHRIIKMED